MRPWLQPMFLSAVATLWFGVALVLAGLLGWLWMSWRRRRQRAGPETSRIRREDALKHLCHCEATGGAATLASLAGVLQLPLADVGALLAEMEQGGLVSFLAGELRLTAAGRHAGVHIVRAHRLWESHLAHHTAVHASEWHAQAEKREHSLSPEETAALSARLGHPAHDPHGDAIPTMGGSLAARDGQPLNTLAAGEAARVVHIEDEPESISAQLAAEGLHLGTRVRLLEKNEQRLRFLCDGAEHVLAPIVAHHVDVLPLSPNEGADEPVPLATLRTGERGRVVALAQTCRAAERQRLLDLGFVRGTEVGVEMKSPTGDPTAYRVRGSVIALRREQAQLVLVSTRPAAAEKAP